MKSEAVKSLCCVRFWNHVEENGFAPPTPTPARRHLSAKTRTKQGSSMQQITPNNPVIRTMGRIDIDVPDRPVGGF